MDVDGTLDAVKMANGQFRFRYITPNGAEHLGAKTFPSAASAKRAGKKWLEETAAGDDH